MLAVHNAAGQVHAVVALVRVGWPVCGAVQQLDGGDRVPPVHQPQPRVQRAGAARLLAPAQAGVQRQVGLQGEFVLHIHACHVACAPGVQVLGRWVQVGVGLGDARVAPVVQAPHQLVACQGCAHPLQFTAPPLPGTHIAVDGERWVVVYIVAHVLVARCVGTAGEGQRGRDLRGVLGRQAGALVGELGARVVEHLRERGRGHALVALGMCQGQRQAIAAHAGKQLGAAVKVQPLGHAVVAVGGVVAWEVKVCAPARGPGGCHQPVAAVGIHGAHRQARLGTALAARFHSHLGPGQLVPVARDDVDHAKESVGPVHRRARPGDKLHPLDQVQIYREVGANAGLVVDVVVEPHPVDQQQHARVVVARRGKAPGAEVVVGAVVRHIQPAHAGQHLCQRAVAKKTDVLGSDHADGRRSFQRGLCVAAGGGHLHLHQLFQWQIDHVCLRIGAGDASEQPGNDQGPQRALARG